MQPEQPALVTLLHDSFLGLTTPNGSIRCFLTVKTRQDMSEQEISDEILHHLFKMIQAQIVDARTKSDDERIANRAEIWPLIAHLKTCNNSISSKSPDQGMPSHESVRD